ncbi:riboflavin synthase [Riemerella columbina]|uniref:riboflavin synthase n=1 Tax=Riemerella columbina TaxID=103810 RepID=UPI0003727020|nr:riboflavin synthase [Riemerella columbina]
MFTGIVEAVGKVERIEHEGTNINFTLSCPLSSELKIDQSLAHNGCCLTVVKVSDSQYQVTAIQETLNKTNLGDWKVGTMVNLERCMVMNGRLDGHIVQGHVDTIGQVVSIIEKDGSFLVTISYNADFVTVPQGSITVNGISLTVAKSESQQFSVAIIPYTWEFTNMQHLKAGDSVNLEFDIIGKYVAKLIQH